MLMMSQLNRINLVIAYFPLKNVGEVHINMHHQIMQLSKQMKNGIEILDGPAQRY